MIVKNEEAVLARCLDSAAGLYDELIIIDTGSQDKTIDVALEYDAKVLHYEWVYPGNKAEARNLGIENAVSQWIVVLDADEVIVNPAGLRKILSTFADFDAISVQFNNFIGDVVNLSWRQIRIFRNGAFTYKYREHEVPIAKLENPRIASPELVFEHRTPEGRDGKSEAMLARLALDVEENPNDPHPLYFYHRQCLHESDNERAIQLGRQYLELTKTGGFIKAEVYGNLAIAYQRMGDMARATEALYMALCCEPKQREWWFRLGALYVDCREYNLALAVLRAAAELLPAHTRQWEPQTTAKIYQLIEHCQHQQMHTLAHSHEGQS